MVTLHLFNLLMSYLLILNDQLKSARDVKGFGVCGRPLKLKIVLSSILHVASACFISLLIQDLKYIA